MPNPNIGEMQNDKTELADRIKHLRAVSGLTYEEIAEELGISRTTLHFIRNGTQAPAERVLRLLEAMEQCRGRLQKPLERTGTNILSLVLAPQTAPSAITVTSEQLTTGHIDVPVNYITDAGGAPAHTITLHRPSTMDGIRTFMSAVVNQTFEDIIFLCMDGTQRGQEALNALTPTSIINLLEVGLQLIFGRDWRTQADQIAERTLTGVLKTTNEVMVNSGLTEKDPSPKQKAESA